MKLATLAVLVRRESRGARGRLLFFTACLAVGVAAVVAVAGLSAALRAGLTAQAAELMAADLALRSRQSLPAELAAQLQRPEIEAVTPLLELASLVGVSLDGDGPALLAQIKAVGPGYPLRGELLLDPPLPLEDLLGSDGAVVAPELLVRLGLSLGDTLALGGQRFVVRGTVLSEPDRLDFSLQMGPRVFVPRAALDDSPLLGFGSMADHTLLMRLASPVAPAALAAVEADLRAALEAHPGVRLRIATQNQPTLREGYQRVESYLALVALVSLLVGGIGVAQTVRAWIGSRVGGIAVLRCLGLRPREVLALYVGQTVVLALAGSAIGALAGVGLIALLPQFLGDLLPAGLLGQWPWQAVARGLLLGVAVALLFALPPLSAVRRVPPSFVLRREGDVLVGSRPARLATALFLVTGLFAVAWLQSGRILHAAVFTGGLLVAFAALSAAGAALVAAATRIPRGRLPLSLRWGVAALARPEAGTVAGVLALGLGVLVVLSMALVQQGLAQNLAAALPREAPNAFFVDIQPDQAERVLELFDRHGARNVDNVPVVTARLVAIDGVEMAERAAQRGGGGRGGGRFRREHRLTWRTVLPDDNVLVERQTPPEPADADVLSVAQPWVLADVAEVSLEQEFAEDLGVSLGAVLTYEAGSRRVDLRVTSLRRVDWRSFRINFFVLAEPGALDGLPHVRLAAAHIPPGELSLLMGALLAEAPNVTVLDVREILLRLGEALTRIGTAVRALGLFTVLAGVMILAGAVGATSLRRAREAALLKTLGLTRAGVLRLHAVEQALVGLVAGVLGAAGGTLLAWSVLNLVMELDWTPPPAALALAVGGSIALAVVAGGLAGGRALGSRPARLLAAE